jgi:hypothetical protein
MNTGRLPLETALILRETTEWLISYSSQYHLQDHGMKVHLSMTECLFGVDGQVRNTTLVLMSSV